MRYPILFFLSVLILAYSCKKDDPKPPASNPNLVEDNYFLAVDDTISLGMFVGDNDYKFDFGDSAGWDGQWTSHHFSKRGTYKLRVSIAGDPEHKVVDSSTILVGDRYVTKIKLVDPALLVKKNGDPWDNDGSGPDFYIAIQSGSKSYATEPVNDITNAMMPVEWEIPGALMLTKDKWTWSIREVVESSTYQPVVGWQFPGSGYKLDGTVYTWRLDYQKKTAVEVYWEIR
jgi:hypothetical protein